MTTEHKNLGMEVLHAYGLPVDKCVGLSIEMNGQEIPVLTVRYALIKDDKLIETLSHYSLNKQN